MNPALAARLRRALDTPLVRAASAADRLVTLLARPGEDSRLVTATPPGGIICFLPSRSGAPRRVLELDRGDSLVTALAWADDGRLSSAVVRSAGGDWIAVEPRAAAHEAWGLSDRLCRLPDGPPGPRQPLTVFQAIDWESITHIPPLAEPARLPAGAGTAVLNLVAALAADQGASRLRYRGPYPTESLFTALLESFRFLGDADPLGRFADGTLDWAPAPHERHFPAEDLCVQLRSGVEKVVWRGRAYYREEWQSVRRHAPRRVRDREGEVRCSLWALGAAVEDHLVLDRDGRLLATLAPPPDPRPPAPLAAPVRDGLAALIRARSAPALAGQIHEIVGALGMEWAGLTGDLVALGDGVRFAWRLYDAGAARAAAALPAERLGAGLALLSEMAGLIGDAVRGRAQAALTRLPPDDQQAALASPGATPDTAALIATGASALTQELARRPPDQQPVVKVAEDVSQPCGPLGNRPIP
jgi:hypothetical protein